MDTDPLARLAHLRALQGTMVDQLARLVSLESPSADLDACAECAEGVAAIAVDVLGQAPGVVEVDGRRHLLWDFGGPPQVVLIGHFDTVWPLGTTARWPFDVSGTHATGPGCFDMKAGIIQALHALATIEDRAGVALLLTSDEEIGSPTSRALVEKTATGCQAAFVLEPAAGASLKVARKGTSNYRIHVEGRAAHAGNSPERGANATVELAHQVLALGALGRANLGTTVTPTVASAGTTTNTVPAAADLDVDVRASTVEEQQRVDAAIRALVSSVPGTSLSVLGGPNRPPLEAGASEALLAKAQRIAERLGLGMVEGAAVGGGSDGNFTAAIGVPTLDGLGAVGWGAHAEGERVRLEAIPERAALLAALVEAVLG